MFFLNYKVSELKRQGYNIYTFTPSLILQKLIFHIRITLQLISFHRAAAHRYEQSTRSKRRSKQHNNDIKHAFYTMNNQTHQHF